MSIGGSGVRVLLQLQSETVPTFGVQTAVGGRTVCVTVMSEVLKEVRERDGAVIVVAGGELTLREAPEFHASLIELCNRSPRLMVIDLADVSFIDSSGVGTLTDIFRRMKRNKGRLGLVGLNKMVRNVFEITRLDKLFSIYETEEEALRS